MHRGSLAFCLLVIFAYPILPASAGAPQDGYRVKMVGSLPGSDGPWDYASFDPARNRVYIAHGNEVLMIDAASGKAHSRFAAGDDLHSVVPVPGTDEIVTTNSGDESARIIDARTGRLLASLHTPEDPDGAIFDPGNGLVVVVCGDAGEVILIDPKARKIVGSIAVGGQLEFPAVNGRGQLYVNVLSAHQVAAVDLSTRKVIARYPLPGCQAPTSLAYVSGGRLISVCVNGRAEILNASSGRVIANLKIGKVPDAVLHDPVGHLALVPSALNGTLAVIALSGPANDSIVDTVRTQIGTRTGTIDPKTGQIWLPAARFKRYSLKQIMAGDFPRMEPGTFSVLLLKISREVTDLHRSP